MRKELFLEGGAHGSLFTFGTVNSKLSYRPTLAEPL
jgi:hypothetical protein